MSPCCDIGDEENDESIERFIWNIEITYPELYAKKN